MKHWTTILLMTMLCITIVAGAEDTQIDLVDIEQKTLIIEESAKTRAELKQYIDKKSIDFKVQTEKAVDENFAVLDQRINGMIRNAGFKLGVIWFSALVFGGTILILINRRIKRRQFIKKHSVDQVLREDQIIRDTKDITPPEPPKKEVKDEIAEFEKTLEPIDPLPEIPDYKEPDYMPSYKEGDSY